MVRFLVIFLILFIGRLELLKPNICQVQLFMSVSYGRAALLGKLKL